MKARFAYAFFFLLLHAFHVLGRLADNFNVWPSETAEDFCDAPLATSWVKVMSSEDLSNRNIVVQQRWFDNAAGILVVLSYPGHWPAASRWENDKKISFSGIDVTTGDERWHLPNLPASTKVGTSFRSSAPVLAGLNMSMLDVATGTLNGRFTIADPCSKSFRWRNVSNCTPSVNNIISTTAGLLPQDHKSINTRLLVIDFLLSETQAADYHIYQAYTVTIVESTYPKFRHLWTSEWTDPYSGFSATKDEWSWNDESLVLLSDSGENLLVSPHDRNHFWRLNGKTGENLNDFYLGAKPVHAASPTFRYVALSPDGMLLVGLGGVHGRGPGDASDLHSSSFNFTFGLWTARVDGNKSAGRRAFVFPIWAGADPYDEGIQRLHWAEDGDLYVTMHFGIYRFHVDTSSGGVSQVSASASVLSTWISSDMKYWNSSDSAPVVSESAAAPDGSIIGWGTLGSNLYQWTPNTTLVRKRQDFAWDGRYVGIWPFNRRKANPERTVSPWNKGAVVVDAKTGLLIFASWDVHPPGPYITDSDPKWYLYAFHMGCIPPANDYSNIYFWCGVIGLLILACTVGVYVQRRARNRRADTPSVSLIALTEP